jgi:transcriptional regulator with AbiEi antitoxin domain of type IV toxin-antitoxin system
MSDWSEVAAVARVQHSVVTTRQLEERGVSRSRQTEYADAGRLDRSHRGVLIVAGSVPTNEQRCMAAAFGAGPNALVSHESAAILQGLPQIPPLPVVQVLVPRGEVPEHHMRGVFVHSSKHVPRLHRITTDGIPTTSPERTLVDISVRLNDRTLRRAFLDGWRLGHYHLGAVAAAVDMAIRLRGRARFRPLLSDADPRYARARSVPEFEGFAALKRRGVWLPEVNHELWRPGCAWPWCVLDQAWPLCKLCFEIDGALYHSLPPDVASDASRQSELEADGWTVERVPASLVLGEPDTYVDLVLCRLRELGHPLWEAQRVPTSPG